MSYRTYIDVVCDVCNCEILEGGNTGAITLAMARKAAKAAGWKRRTVLGLRGKQDVCCSCQAELTSKRG